MIIHFSLLQRALNHIPQRHSSMIKFQPDDLKSVLPSVIFTVLIILCCLVSLFLNPVIFLFNRGRKSIAASLYATLSSIDFFYCTTLAFVLLLQAHQVTKLKGLIGCFGISDEEYWNCIYLASTGQKLSTAVLLCLDSEAVTTTGLLAIVRFIQLNDPLTVIRKKVVSLSIALVFTSTVCLHCFSLFSPIHKAVYSPMLMFALNADPYGFGFAWTTQYASILITSFITILVQLGAFASAILAAVVLYKKHRTKTSSSARPRSRKRSRKVLLTNLPSFLILLRVVVEAPIWSIARNPDKPGLYTEFQGWIIFSLHRMLPLLASTWNPVIFISLTPKTRKLLRSTLSRSTEKSNQVQNKGRIAKVGNKFFPGVGCLFSCLPS